ncbi:MAG: DUF2384 domain-containing protein [Coriobacteriia bacterium]|nr:DUF2384 domain-containing protein [Coriobacteriia bacterium]
MKSISSDRVENGLADIAAASPVNVESIRSGLGLTIEEFATAVGRSTRSVCRWQSTGSDHSTARGEAARSVRQLARLQFLIEDVLGRSYGPEWLRSPNRGFRGHAPVDLILDGKTDIVIAALERLADGGPA